MAHNQTHRLPFWKIWFRRAIAFLGKPIVPDEVIDRFGGLQQAGDLMRAGSGLLILINHFSLRDPVTAMALIFRTPVLRTRTIVAPMAYHQYVQYGLFGRFLARLGGISLQPVVTGDTLKTLKDSPPRGQGLQAYLEAASAALAAGQIVLLAPQGGRREKLGRPPGRPVASLISSAHKDPAAPTALLCVGLAVKGAQSYARSNVGGLNFGRVYELRIGPVATPAAVIAAAGNLRRADFWAFEQLAELTPAVYGRPDLQTKEGNGAKTPDLSG